MVDFIENGVKIANYKTCLARFSGVGSANSKAANNDFSAGVSYVNPVSVFPSAVCTVWWPACSSPPPAG